MRQRQYHVECTGSRQITEVKQRWAWIVLGWETAWEHQVLLAFGGVCGAVVADSLSTQKVERSIPRRGFLSEKSERSIPRRGFLSLRGLRGRFPAGGFSLVLENAEVAE